MRGIHGGRYFGNSSVPDVYNGPCYAGRQVHKTREKCQLTKRPIGGMKSANMTRGQYLTVTLLQGRKQAKHREGKRGRGWRGRWQGETRNPSDQSLLAFPKAGGLALACSSGSDYSLKENGSRSIGRGGKTQERRVKR